MVALCFMALAPLMLMMGARSEKVVHAVENTPIGPVQNRYPSQPQTNFRQNHRSHNIDHHVLFDRKGGDEYQDGHDAGTAAVPQGNGRIPADSDVAEPADQAVN